MRPGKGLQQADIHWSEGLPLSRQFNDVYYSRENGLAESTHVFIDGNQLPQRWAALGKSGQFTLIETGFGTGLNFINAVGLWLKVSPPDAKLHYLSVEKYPLSQQAIEQALGHWEELGELSKDLLASYPPLVAGYHRRWLYGDRVCLTLIFDDALDGFSELLLSDHPQFRHAGPPLADAWFLDGFAPAKNPELWCPELFEMMACFSHKQTTLATFTVARAVREGLTAAGFETEKMPGYGRKREMLRGVFAGEKPTLPRIADYHPPKVLRNSRFQPPWYLSAHSRPEGKSVAVIGAGIAGCTTAAALRRRGFSVALYDRHGQVGMEASGNSQGIIYPKLSLEDSPLSLYAVHSLCYGRAFYQAYWQSGFPGNKCGVLVLPESEEDKALFQKIANRYQHASGFVKCLNSDAVSEVTGFELAAGIGLYYPDLGWVSPRDLGAWLTRELEIVGKEIHQIIPLAQAGQWSLLDGAGDVISRADHVVIANSYLAREFVQCSNLPLRPVRGQITNMPVSEKSARLRTVLCGSGYLAPVFNGIHTLGATYGFGDENIEIRPDDHMRNVTSLGTTDPALSDLFIKERADPSKLDGRAGVRCTTPDYLPIVGAVANEDEMRQRFSDLGKNAKADIPLSGSYHHGLWLNVGHGSRGLTYAPLAAEIIAAQISGELSPVPRQLTTALNPARFIIRHLKRKQLREQ